MKTAHEGSPAADGKKFLSSDMLSRREVLAGAGAIGAMMLLPEVLSSAPDGKKTFTILHTNDLHSNLIGVSPASDFTPFTLNDDQRGEVQDYGAGPARIAFLWRRQNEADSVPLIKGGTWVSAVACQSIG